jgi:recombination protein RecR
MQPEPIKKLIEYFTRLPGIGPRQASRFASTLLDEDETTLAGFGETLIELSRSVGRCDECFRSIEKREGRKACDLCTLDTTGSILVVEKDQDLETISKTGTWPDGYHVLGGTISLLNEKSRVTDRIRGLHARLAKKAREDSPIEVVLATSATTEGDSTALYIERILEPFVKEKKVSVTRLGRGISTGTEMEFADPQTLRDALKNRK